MKAGAGRTTAGVLVLGLVAGSSGAVDWPMFMGAGRDGVSAEKGLKAWQEAPKILWKANVGAGYSSAAVAGGRVYTMGGQDGVWCLDAEKGAVVWSYPGEAAPGAGGRGRKGGGETQGTPAVGGGRVYAVTKGGQLLCLDAASGRAAWSKGLGAEFGVTWGGWKAAVSPLLDGERLILDVGKVVVLEAATGATVWKAGSDTASYSSARLLANGTSPCVTSFNAGGLVIHEMAGGKERGRFPWKTAYDVNAAMPIVSGDKIFISSGYGRGCALLTLGADGLKPVYENKEMANHCQMSVLIDGNLYGVHGQQGSGGSLKCLEMATGRTRWEQPGLKVGGGLIAADGKLIVLADGGELILAEASPRGFASLARGKVLDGKCWTVPALSGGRVYCRSYAGDLVCVDLR